MKKQKLLLALISGCCILNIAIAAPPLDEKGFQVYTGSTLIKEERTPEKGTLAPPGTATTANLTWKVKAPPEKVLSFYIDSFNGRPDEPATEYQPVLFWQAAGLQCMLIFHPQEEALSKPARGTLPWASGLINSAMIQWTSSKPDGDETSFTMGIEDTGNSTVETTISLSIITVNSGAADQQARDLADAGAAAIENMVQGINHIDPDKQRLVDEMTNNPPPPAELAIRIRNEFGVPLYKEAKLQVRAMEYFAYDTWGGVGGYWFLSKDMPETIVRYYEKITGNKRYQQPLDATFYIDITDSAGKTTGTIAIFQGTMALWLHEESPDADPGEVLLVSTLGFFKSGKLKQPESAGGR